MASQAEIDALTAAFDVVMGSDSELPPPRAPETARESIPAPAPSQPSEPARAAPASFQDPNRPLPEPGIRFAIRGERYRRAGNLAGGRLYTCAQ